MDECIFCKIARHDVPKDFAYEDEDVMAFADTHPVKPTHLLIVPKKHITDFLALDDDALWNKILQVGQELIHEYNLEENGFRLSTNGGGYQLIDHLHVHLMGPMGKKASE